MKTSSPSPKGSPRSQPRSPSWIVERDALREVGDRKTLATIAVFIARRSAKKEEFFVHPNIAQLQGLTPNDLNWALDKLEGVVVEALGKRKGKYRMIRLLPQFEEAERENAMRSRRGRQKSEKVPPGEEKVSFDKSELLSRISETERRTAPGVLQTLREIASGETGLV